jgi:hypothetical protein
MPSVSSQRVAKLARFNNLEELQTIKPEWLRIPAAVRVSGLSRTYLLSEIVKDSFVTKHIKKPGKKKGIRLINYASLMEFINNLE